MKNNNIINTEKLLDLEDQKTIDAIVDISDAKNDQNFFEIIDGIDQLIKGFCLQSYKSLLNWGLAFYEKSEACSNLLQKQVLNAKAIDLLKMSYAVDNSEDDAPFFIGVILFRGEKLYEAQRWLEISKSLNNADSEVCFYLGLIKMCLDDNKAAEVLLLEAIYKNHISTCKNINEKKEDGSAYIDSLEEIWQADEAKKTALNNYVKTSNLACIGEYMDFIPDATNYLYD